MEKKYCQIECTECNAITAETRTENPKKWYYNSPKETEYCWKCGAETQLYIQDKIEIPEDDIPY